jgi:hypothetical protein
MKIKKFYQINETFGFEKKEEPKKLSRVNACIEDIIDFLKDNNIKNWDEFMDAPGFEKWTVNTIIDTNCENKEELDEVRYKVKLKLSNIEQLKDMISEYEDMEEYEKCSEIQKEIENKKTL